MAQYSPKTWVTGEPITAAELNAIEAAAAAAAVKADTDAAITAASSADRARANHTGTQAIGTVTGLQTALDAKLDATTAASTYVTQANAIDLESTQDSVAGMFTGGTHSGISFTYNDPGNVINATVTPASAADATTTSKGAVQLAGDLAGTATAPTVPGLAGKLTAASNLSDVASAATARTNLGLGTAATQPTTAFDAAGAAAAVLPSQAGSSGKYLTTNGTAASWGTVPAGSTLTDRGDWATGTAYNVGDIVSYAYQRWTITTAHTAGTTFDTTKAALLGRTVAGQRHTPLRTARAAYAARHIAPFNVCVIGDSVVEGTGSTGPETTGRRWISRMLTRLQKDNPPGVAGGLGLIPVSNQDSAMSPWTFAAGASGASLQPRVLGKRGSNFPANGTATITLPATTSIDVHYWQGSAATPAFTVSINGTATTVTPAQTGGLNNNGKTTVSAGVNSSGSNTVILTAAASGTSYIDAIFHYNGDEAGGTRLQDAGHFGWTSSQYASDISSNNNANGYAPKQPQFGTHLYVIALGLNDYSGQVAVATFKSNIQAIITAAKGWQITYTASFLLISPYIRGDVSAPTIPLSDYRDALYQIAAADPNNVAVVDMNERFITNPATDNTLGLMGVDNVHPTDKGHSFFADAVTAALLPVA